MTRNTCQVEGSPAFLQRTLPQQQRLDLVQHVEGSARRRSRWITISVRLDPRPGVSSDRTVRSSEPHGAINDYGDQIARSRPPAHGPRQLVKVSVGGTCRRQIINGIRQIQTESTLWSLTIRLSRAWKTGGPGWQTWALQSPYSLDQPSSLTRVPSRAPLPPRWVIPLAVTPFDSRTALPPLQSDYP